MRISLLTVLNELLGAEQELATAYGQAVVLYTQNGLTQDAVDRYTALRDELYADETSVHDLLTSLLSPLGLADRIPAPTRMPDLSPNVTPSSVAAGGLGAIPVLGWVALVLAFLIEMAAVAYVVTRLYEIGADLVTRIYQVHTDSRNYELQLSAASDRFNACLRAGRTPAECAASNPLPAPPQRPLQTTGDYAFEILAAGGVVAGLGALGWLAYQHRKS